MDNSQIKRVRIGNLKTIGDLGKEMRRVYRQAHTGEIPVDHMSRYVNALNIIIGATREHELEARINELESLLQGDKAA